MADRRCLVYILILSCFAVAALSSPWHASCQVEWSFPKDCSTIQHKILEVINNWKGEENCIHGGEKCLYELSSHTDNELKAVHMTPVKKYKDDLTFTFTTSQSGCSVKGYSTSETWYAVLDYGTNYCNLHNLITGSALDKDTGYKETTSDSICTQYSTADCEKY